MTNLVDKYKVIKFIEDYKENHNKEPQKYPINYGTLLDIMRWLYCMPTVEAVPLSVIEKIKAEIDNDRLCYAEELQKPLKKKHTLYELKEYTARQELLSIKCAICQDVLDIIDKAVKECTHED